MLAFFLLNVLGTLKSKSAFPAGHELTSGLADNYLFRNVKLCLRDQSRIGQSKLKEDIMLREYNLTGCTKFANFFCLDDPVLIDNGSSNSCLICPDGSLIGIKQMENNREDEKLHIKGQATVGTIISIINAGTDEILADAIKVDRGEWEAKIDNVGNILENITVMTSNDVQLTRRSKIVKKTMMIMTINVKSITERRPPVELCWTGTS
jgi:hypothetical protein